MLNELIDNGFAAAESMNDRLSIAHIQASILVSNLLQDPFQWAKSISDFSRWYFSDAFAAEVSLGGGAFIGTCIFFIIQNLGYRDPDEAELASTQAEAQNRGDQNGVIDKEFQTTARRSKEETQWRNGELKFFGAILGLGTFVGIAYYARMNLGK